MTEKLRQLSAAKTKEAVAAAADGIEHIERSCRQLRIVLHGGAYRASQRVHLIQQINNGLGLLVTAIGRLGILEDLRPALLPPPRTKESLTQAVQDAAMELSRYTDDSEDSHDYNTGEEEIEPETSDDPPEAVAANPTPVYTGVSVMDIQAYLRNLQNDH